MMTRKQYREYIEMFGMSQRGAAKFFDIGERTSRRLAGKHAEIPRPIEMVLRIMAAKKLSPEGCVRDMRHRTAGARLRLLAVGRRDA